MFQLDDFEQRAHSQILEFYRATAPEMLAIYEIPAEYKDVPGFPNLNKSALRKCCVELGFWCKQ